MHVKVAEESSMVSFPLYDSFSKIGSTVLSGRECNKDVEVCWYAKSKHSDRLCSYVLGVTYHGPPVGVWYYLFLPH